MDSVGSIYLDLNLNKKPFESQLAGVSKSVSGSGGLTSSFMGLGKVIGAAFAVKALVDFSRSAIKLGSDLNEVQNVVDVTFGQGAGKINDFAKTAQSAFGLSELAAKQYSGTMGAMFKSMGFSTGSASQMSTTMAGLAGDMASFYNLTTDEAFSKLRSGMSGETEPLKQLGINLSVANLEAFALSKGMRQSYQSMDQLTQAQLRYEYTLRATSAAQGDFARTSGSWANQTRLLSLQWDSFKASMGQGLISLLTPVLQTINTVMAKLVQFGEVFRSVMASLFGDAGGSMAAVAVSTEDAGDSMGDLAGGIGKASKAAKGSLASFDRLNVLTSAIGSGGSGGASSIIKATTQTKAATSAANILKDKFEDIVKPIRNIIDGIKTFGKTIWESGLKGFFESLGRTFSNIWDTGKNIIGWLDKLSAWAGGSGSIVKDLAWLIGQGFKLAGAGLEEVSIWLDLISKGDWAGLGNRITTGVTNALNGINTLLTNWSKALPDWAKNILGIDTSIGTTHTSASGATHGGGGASMGGSGGRAIDYTGGGRAIPEPSYTYYGGVRPAARIPQMADGGIVSRPTLAMIGERRGSPEAVIPLNQLDKYTGGGSSETNRRLDTLISLMSRMQFPSEFMIDGKKAGEILLEPVLNAARRSGQPYPVRG